MWMKDKPIPTAPDKAMLKALPPHKARCAYCNRQTIAERMDSAILNNRGCARRTRDHVVPSAFGGMHMVICCDGCNSVKGDAPEQVFRFFVSCNLSDFQSMDETERGRMQRRFRRFVYDLTLAGFIAAKALARVKKTYRDSIPPRAPNLPRAPNGRFTKRDLLKRSV